MSFLKRIFAPLAVCLLLSFIASSAGFAAPKDVKDAKDSVKTPAQLKAISDRYRPVFRALTRWLEDAPAPDSKVKTRENKLRTMDQAMTQEDAKKLTCVGEFFQTRMKEFMDLYLKSNPGDDTIIWKMYNHAEIVQTRDIAIAFDLVGGYDQLEINSETMKLLIDHIDVLMISNKTAGHADMRVVDMFIAAGRPVVAPELFWANYKNNDRLTVIHDGSLEYPGAQIRVYPSTAKTTMNNVYLMKTASGRTIMHTGDNEVEAGKEWFRRFKKPINVDIMIPDMESPNLQALVRQVKPGAIIPSHENELWRPPSERLTYSNIYTTLKALKLPYYVPAWGEQVKIPAGQDF